ncbi:MAG: hypothetical protein HY331_18515 [Chloroflexi bacterium]|nr:hypothetical protein [Chloroflexota bacterium]
MQVKTAVKAGFGWSDIKAAIKKNEPLIKKAGSAAQDWTSPYTWGMKLYKNY